MMSSTLFTSQKKSNLTQTKIILPVPYYYSL